MKNSFGDAITLSIFGESHGEAIGALIDSPPPGLKVSKEEIAFYLKKRRPAGLVSTARVEADEYRILSGVYNGMTTGTPVMIEIPNTAQRSGDYKEISSLARPSHADAAAYSKYHGFEDRRGGGHFSGRITAALVAAGALFMPALNKKGIKIGTHVLRCAGVSDREFINYDEDIEKLRPMNFPVLSDEAGEKMQEKILAARSESDSVGGVTETVITGLMPGLGEPYFDSLESRLSHAMFSLGGVKGIEFGKGFAISDMRGSEANDPFYMKDGKVLTRTNNNGGINGGISNGMPVIFRLAVKPTPSIAKKQETVDFEKGTDSEIEIKGRHDPCICHRVGCVAECLTAFVLADIITARFGTDYLAL